MFNNAVRLARAKYYTNTNDLHKGNSRVLFSTLNHLVNASFLKSFGVLQVLCEPFLSLFIKKVDNTRKLIKCRFSAAFNTVDHNILLSRLKQWAGVQGTALSWFDSYSRQQTFSVYFEGFCSTSAPVKYGIPQGSILGPTFFPIYMFSLYVRLLCR